MDDARRGAAGSLPATAGTLYRWTTADGTVSVTDDPDRIPERYKAIARAVEDGRQKGFGRYSPTDGAADELRGGARRAGRTAAGAECGPDALDHGRAPVARAPRRAALEAVVELNDATAVRMPLSGTSVDGADHRRGRARPPAR